MGVQRRWQRLVDLVSSGPAELSSLTTFGFLARHEDRRADGIRRPGALFLVGARLGIAMRGVVDDADLISLSGTAVRRAAWAIGGVVRRHIGDPDRADARARCGAARPDGGPGVRGGRCWPLHEHPEHVRRRSWSTRSFWFLERLAKEGAAMLLVEQYVTRALELADYVYVL